MMESPDALSAEASELFTFWGAEGEDEDAGDDNADEGSEEEQEQEDEQQEDEDDDEKPKPKAKQRPPAKDDEEDEEEDAEAQLAKLKRENIRLKKAAADKEDKDKTEKDKDKLLNKANAKVKQYERVMATTYIEHAIMKLSGVKDKDGNPKYDWHDIEDVRAAIDRDQIDINLDTGEVDGLDLELKRIAKRKPHYLRGGEEQEEEENQGRGRGGRGNPGRPPAGRQPTGGHPYGGRSREGETDRKKLMDKYKIGPQYVSGQRI